MASAIPEGFQAVTKDGGVLKKVVEEGEEAEYEDDDEVTEPPERPPSLPRDSPHPPLCAKAEPSTPPPTPSSSLAPGRAYRPTFPLLLWMKRPRGLGARVSLRVGA